MKLNCFEKCLGPLKYTKMSDFYNKLHLPHSIYSMNYNASSTNHSYMNLSMHSYYMKSSKNTQKRGIKIRAF